jgi:hypothetical protein
MPDSVFYSWQSDTRPAGNRTLIHNALETAIADLRGFGNPKLDLVLDRDTVGVTGSPDISSTIFAKINASAAVVADVTLVDDKSEKRRFPNPNVLIELGYAIKSIGLSRVVMVQNTFFGEVEDLPFDLRGKRILTYTSDPNVSIRADITKTLAAQLRMALVAILSNIEDSSGDDFDVHGTEREIIQLISASPDDVVAKLREIIQDMDRRLASDDAYASLMHRIVDTGRYNPKIPNEFRWRSPKRASRDIPQDPPISRKGLFMAVCTSHTTQSQHI